MRPTKREIEEENKKMRYLRVLVDLTTAILLQGVLSVPESLDLISSTKRHILSLFPDKEDTYDLIYKPRFERLIKEKFATN